MDEVKIGHYYLHSAKGNIVRVTNIFKGQVVVYEIIKDTKGSWDKWLKNNPDQLPTYNIKSFKKYYKYQPAYNSPLYKVLNS